MATLAAAAIVQAVRDVIEDEHGSVRTISDGTYEAGPSEGASPRVEGNLSLAGPRAEVRIVDVQRHPASPPPQGSFQLVSVTVEVRVVRVFTMYEALNDASRSALKAAAASDALDGAGPERRDRGRASAADARRGRTRDRSDCPRGV